MKRIDSHQHYWKISRGDYHWMTPDAANPLYADFLPEDLHPHLEACGIHGTILVQAARTLEETRFMLELADRHPSISGVVGWVDLASDDCLRIREFQKHSRFVGIRPMLEEEPADSWILNPAVRNHLRILQDMDFPVDLQMSARHLPYVAQVLEEMPNLRFVIDHIALLEMRPDSFEFWSPWMGQCAAFPKVMCKLSGFYNIACDRKYTVEDLRPYTDFVWNAFGPQRVMYGSDWPVCLLGCSSYEDAYGIIEQLLPDGLTGEQIDDIYGGNALRFYKLR